MQVWEEQLEQMLDQASAYVEDWEPFLNMLAEADTPQNREQLHAYLEKVMPNIKQHNRKLNRVEYSRDPRGYYIYNYTFDMFKWYNSKKFDAAYIRPDRIFIGITELTPDEVEFLQDKRTI